MNGWAGKEKIAKNDNTKYSKEDFIMDLTKASTAELVEELAKYSGVPVWNGLTDQFHPTQMLADLLTIEEKLGRLKGINFTYMGDARNNMGNSLMVACAKMGLNFTACAPKALFHSR